MSIKFEKLHAGMTLYDVRRQRGRLCTWHIHVLEVDTVNQRALVSWNSNPSVWKSARYFRGTNIRQNKPATL